MYLLELFTISWTPLKLNETVWIILLSGAIKNTVISHTSDAVEQDI